MPNAALIVAAGRGSRARAAGASPKQYADLAGRTVLRRTLDVFTQVAAIDVLQVVIHPDDHALYEAAVTGCDAPLRPPVTGGATRQASVLAGLEALAPLAPRTVLIHDAARPFVTPREIERVLEELTTRTGALLAVPLADTLKREGVPGVVAATIERRGLWRAQTPQGFRFGPIIEAHRRAAREAAGEFTDDAAVAEWAGLEVGLVAGSAANEKITTAEDLAMATRKAADAGPMAQVRIGTGFDVHRLIPGDHVWLCGVCIPHSHTLEGHSDADVGLHALTDALLGAIADGDIGAHFPPSDPAWKGAASHLFLADAARRVRARGGEIVNVDVTLLCEAPRIGPHREAMRAAIAASLEISTDRVGVKATTTEGLGFTGRREGIAAMASASVQLPPYQPAVGGEHGD